MKRVRPLRVGSKVPITGIEGARKGQGWGVVTTLRSETAEAVWFAIGPDGKEVMGFTGTTARREFPLVERGYVPESKLVAKVAKLMGITREDKLAELKAVYAYKNKN